MVCPPPTCTLTVCHVIDLAGEPVAPVDVPEPLAACEEPHAAITVMASGAASNASLRGPGLSDVLIGLLPFWFEFAATSTSLGGCPFQAFDLAVIANLLL